MKNIVFRSKKIFSPFRPFLNNINHRIAKKNIKKFPQIAIFSFDHVGLLINLDGRYEHSALELIKDYILTNGRIDPTSCALDIGANIGNHALFFAEYFKHIFAFEPNPQAYRLLEFNIVSRNISALNYGVSDKNCMMSFQVSTSNIGGSKILENNDDAPDGKVIDVEVKRLDNLIELEDAKISFIKIDVEGHELSALKGAKAIIERNDPIIIFEQGIDEISDGSSAVIDFLRSYGYRFQAIENRFDFGENFLLKLASLLLKTTLGYQKILVEKASFEKKHYEMIVAIK
ncbi:FkbM family methyltransferase [Alphaproteobacteria bacterium]|nr:FkbM family methyltransferase [Alphaproteobacteria bacterium]